jgi:hypothetical protein
MRGFTNNLIFSSVLMALLFFTSCADKLNPFGNVRKKDLYSDIRFDFMESRAKLKYTSDIQKISAIANIRIQKDSVIWISLSPALGIELARVYIDRKEIQAIDKLKKEYYCFTYEDLSRQYGVNVHYDLIESIVVGNVMFAPEDSSTVSREGNRVLIRYEEGPYGVVHYVDKKSKKLKELEAFDRNTNNTISVNYSKFQPLGDQIFAADITAKIQFADNNRKGPTKIELEYKKTEIQDSPLSFPFHVSDRYTRK